MAPLVTSADARRRGDRVELQDASTKKQYALLWRTRAVSGDSKTLYGCADLQSVSGEPQGSQVELRIGKLFDPSHHCGGGKRDSPYSTISNYVSVTTRRGNHQCSLRCASRITHHDSPHPLPSPPTSWTFFFTSTFASATRLHVTNRSYLAHLTTFTFSIFRRGPKSTSLWLEEAKL